MRSNSVIRRPLRLTRSAGAILFALAAMLGTTSPPATAGVAGENVILVVNADSKDSRTVANHYAQLRQIPSGNVVFLKDVPAGLTTTLDDFRDKILKPLFATIDERKLANQTRVIAYSVGFPTSVKVDAHTSKLTDPDQKKYQLPVGSINGLTYLYRFVMTDDPAYLGWTPNLYARGAFERNFVNPFAGEKGERFDDAMEKFDGDDPAGAARIFKELATEYPTLSPVWIRAAEAFARSDDASSAAQSLVMALRGGWNSATYIRQSEDLDELAENPAIAKALERISDAPIVMQNPIGFGGGRGWTSSGHPIASNQGGIAYLMSCVLGVVHERGSTVEQVVESLQRSAAADRTFPDGTFGFSKTGDVRTTTRMPGVPAALGRLLWLGKTPELFKTPLPTTADEFAGLLLGTATMNLRDKPFTILPGAICESLTSTGAAFGTASQTKCTELLHAGAAITSGAVTEPYSLQFKFPAPAMQAYYAEGVSAIEAFYLSVTSPYQLLIVGDPVCQPFAKAATAQVSFQTIRGEGLEIVIRKQDPLLLTEKVADSRIEIFAQGRLARTTASTGEIKLRLPADTSGALDFRVALINGGPLETRISYPQSVDLDGPLETPTLDVTSNAQGEVKIQTSAKGADSIGLVHLGESIGRIEGSQGEIIVSRADLGDGPLRIRAIAKHGETEIQSEAAIEP